MPKDRPVADLTLERVNKVGREMAALRETVETMTRMLAAQMTDLGARMGRLETGQHEIAETTRGVRMEVIGIANQILNAQSEAARAHFRLDDAEDRQRGADA